MLKIEIFVFLRGESASETKSANRRSPRNYALGYQLGLKLMPSLCLADRKRCAKPKKD